MSGETDRCADDAELSLLLAAIVKSSVDAIVATTLDGVVTSWNPGAEAMFGYTAEEMTGRHVSVLIPPDRAGELASILGQIQRGRRVHHFETRRVRQDGTLIDVSLSVSPVRDRSGAIHGAAAVARDITERNWAEAERRAAEARQRQAERMETASRLAGGMASEFGNLLSAIMGYTASVADATAGDPRVQADAHQIQAAAGCAARLARDLRLFSCREPARPEQVDLNAVLASTREVLQASVGADIDVRLITAPYLPTVMAERGQIEQVLLNLAVNARDVMPQGGIVTFTTGVADPGDAHGVVWPGTRPGRCAQLTVSDTGRGMDAETMSRAFEPFFTTKPPGQGTGLGLSAVYGIVTKAGGAITIDSEAGLGTTFHIYLPAAYVPAQGPAPGRSPGGRPDRLDGRRPARGARDSRADPAPQRLPHAPGRHLRRGAVAAVDTRSRTAAYRHGAIRHVQAGAGRPGPETAAGNTGLVHVWITRPRTGRQAGSGRWQAVYREGPAG